MLNFCYKVIESLGYLIIFPFDRYMMDKVVENEKEIQEKTSELIALKTEMDKKKKSFDEVEKNMIYKSREIQRIKEELEVKETKLEKVNEKLKETVRAKEEQEHLVSKHRETEVKLNIQAKKLQTGCDVLGQDIEKVHDKLDNVKAIETANETVKDSFKENITDVVEKLTTQIKEFGKENEDRGNVLMDSVDQELSSRQEQITDLLSDLQKLLASHQTNYQDGRNDLEKEMESANSTQTEVGSLVEKSSKEGKSLGEDYVSQIVPSLEIIAEKVTNQKDCLQKFSANIQQDLGKIRSNVGKSVEEIVQIIGDTEQLVKEHFHREEKSVGELKEINNQVVTSQETLKKTVDLMLTAYKKHHEDVGKLNGQANVVIKKLAEQNIPLKETVENNVSNLRNAANVLEKETSKQVEGAERKAKTSVDESEEICEDVEKAAQHLKTESGRFFKESIESYENSHEGLQKANNLRKELIENAEVVNQKKSDVAKTEYEGACDVFATKLKGESKSSTELQLGDLKDLSKENVAELTEKLVHLDEEVSTLVWEDLKVYQPTGETPVRTERQYPRYLASTDPHHRILDKFRKAAEAEAEAENSTEGTEDPLTDSELSYSLDTENKLDRSGRSGKRELKKPEVIRRNILGTSNQ